MISINKMNSSRKINCEQSSSPNDKSLLRRKLIVALSSVLLLVEIPRAWIMLNMTTISVMPRYNMRSRHIVRRCFGYEWEIWSVISCAENGPYISVTHRLQKIIKAGVIIMSFWPCFAKLTAVWSEPLIFCKFW